MLDSIQSMALSCQFQSEGTAQVDAFVSGRNQTTLTASSFKAAMPHLASETVTTESFDDVVTTQQDADANWLNLRDFLETNLNSLTVFKTGSVRREVFIVGLTSGGNIVGVRSFAVET